MYIQHDGDTLDSLLWPHLNITVDYNDYSQEGNYPENGWTFPPQGGLEEPKIDSQTFHVVELLSCMYLTNQLSVYDVIYITVSKYISDDLI